MKEKYYGVIAYIIAVIITIILIVPIAIAEIKDTDNRNAQQEYIKQLEQNNIEQAEEKEVYINKCKMYEDILEVNGLLDECECK